MTLAMSLKIDFNWKRILKYIFWLVVAVLFIVYVVRVLVFERNYYNEKEGSERAIVTVVEEEEELIEVKPTETEVVE